MRKADEREQIAKKISDVKIGTSLSRFVMSGEGGGVPSREALKDRARRAKLKDTRDLTGILLGDPPPERSALDAYRRKEQEVGTRSIWEGYEHVFEK